MDTLKLTIDGMRCGGCVRRVRETLGQVPGISVADVSVGTAVVTVEEARTSADAVVQALAKAGYRAQPEVAREYR